MYIYVFVCRYKSAESRSCGRRDLSREIEENRITQYNLHKAGKGGIGVKKKGSRCGGGGENPQERTIYKNARANILHCGQIEKQNLLTSLNKESSSPKFGN